MYKSLATIHASYNIYPGKLINSRLERSIINDINNVSGLSYLADFYKSYLQEYGNKVSALNTNILLGAARSVDLPFIGQNILRQYKSKFVFYFEGSLQDTDYFSNTVLSCLWTLDDIDLYKNVIERYWRMHSYLRIHDSLRITPQIAINSYVADSFRIGKDNGKMDTKLNRELMIKEIKLLNPDAIILVGGTARYIAGQDLLEEYKDKIQCVPFPTVRKTKGEKHHAELLYDALSVKMQSLLLT